MKIFSKKFAKRYPEIIEHLSIDFENGKINIFSIPTQHFTVNSLDELTEEQFLLRILNRNFPWEEKKVNKKQEIRLRKLKLNKIKKIVKENDKKQDDSNYCS